MKKFNLRTLPKKYTLSKPKKYKLINPELIEIINSSQFYSSSFDDPSQTGLSLDQLTYRLTQKQKERWIEGIYNDDSRIVNIKQRKGFVIIVCRNALLNNHSKLHRYIIFADERKGESNEFEKEESAPIKKKKDRLHYVQNKSKSKRKGKRKSRRK